MEVANFHQHQQETEQICMEEPTLAVKPITDDYTELIDSCVWSERYNGYELIMNELKGSEDGFNEFKNKQIDIAKILEEPHSLAKRKAYKLVSIYIRLEDDVDTIKKSYIKLCKHALGGGISDRFTFRYSIRIICQLFEKLSNVDDLNKLIHEELSKDTKIVKATIGLLSLTNFFTCKYGPEKIDTILFTDTVCKYCSHQNPKVRKEAYKFFVFVAKWKENCDSVKAIVQTKVKLAQRKTLFKMLETFKTFENQSQGISYDDMLEESDDDTWYNKDGTKMSRKDYLLNIDTESQEQIKFGPMFVRQTISNYRWVDRVSKLDEIIFDLTQDKVVTGELRYITELLENMFNSYNLNVLLKACRLLSLLILKFTKNLTPHMEILKPSLQKSLINKKAAYQIEISKVFYYLSKYCLTYQEYVSFLLNGIWGAKDATSIKFLVEILVTFLDNDEVTPDQLCKENLLAKSLESLLKKYPFCIREYIGIVLIHCQAKYSDSFESMLSPTLQEYYDKLSDAKVKQCKQSLNSMITRCQVGIDCVKNKLEPKDLEVLFDEGYESYEQLSLETSSQCSSDFDFVEKEEIPDDIFIDINTETDTKADEKGDNCVIF